MRRLRFLLLSALVLAGCLTAAELGRRILDGYRILRLDLVPDPRNTDLTSSTDRPTQALLETIPADVEADSSWFYDRPEPIRAAAPDWAEKRRQAFAPTANYIWNEAALKDPGVQDYLRRNTGLEEIFTFRTPTGEPYPSYRLYPDIETGLGATNRFGWRSRQITAEKPPNVIRIGMLGDSTTNAYPALVEHWLNLWAVRRNLGVRFEIANAARPATGAYDAAAILDFELGSIDPDYLVIYGFGNGIYVADALIDLPRGIVKGQPSKTAVSTGVIGGLTKRIDNRIEPLARWSAAAAFLRNRVDGQRRGRLLAEPPKPATRLRFPAGIDEVSPDPEKIANYAGGGLMVLETYLQGLNKIDAMAKNRGIRLAVSTFRIMAFDGMLLANGGSATGSIIYRSLNEQVWWPYTYAQIRRLTRFYNLTLRTWAEKKGQDVIPIDEQMPWRPELYGDGMHELPAGEALHAWIVLQTLMPRVRDDLVHHRVPRPTRRDDRNLASYWNIDRTSVKTVIDRPETGAIGTPDVPADDIIGAFPLSKITTAYAGAEVIPGNVPVIRTAAEPSGYAALIPVGVQPVAGLTGKGWSGVRIRVNEGHITVGILDKSAQKFLTYVNLDQRADIQEVRLAIDSLSDVGSLIIANNRPGENARSVAELHSVVLKRLRQ